MRIALLSDYPMDPNRIYGGVQAVAYHLAEGLAEHDDLDVHVIHSSREVSANSVSVEGRLTVHHIAPPAHSLTPNLIASLSPCSRVLRSIKPDLANAHTGQYALAALRSGVPTIYTIHGIQHLALRHARGARNWCAGAVQVLFDRLVIRRVGDIITISPHVEATYRKRTKARFHRVENLVPDKWFSTVAREVPGRILFVGTVASGKGLHLLVQALGQLVETVPEAHLHAAGGLHDFRYAKYLHRLVDDLHLNDRLSLLGPLDGAAMQQEYSRCALLVLPSLNETAPVAVMEAMAAGRPVVATRVGGVPDLVEDGVTGFLVQPGEVSGLSECVGRLLRDSELRTGMGQRGREVARVRFRRDTIVARYREIYEEVLKNPGITRIPRNGFVKFV